MSNISTSELLLNKVNNNQSESSKIDKNSGESFADTLKDSISKLNELQEDKDKAMSDIATGQVKNLHQAAIAIDKAEVSMKLALEIRNKAISAYKELLKTQI
jgi:flagellar hook-basal body complex protein FliE